MAIQKKFFIKNFPSWDIFIKILDYKYESVEKINKNVNYQKYYLEQPNIKNFVYNKKNKTDIFIYNRLDPQCFNIINENTVLFLSKEMKNLINEIHNISKNNFYKSKIILNFVGKEGYYYAHKDSQDVISLQCAGNIEYRIYENVDCNFSEPVNTVGLKYQSYLMSPGDIIYIPKGTIHQVIVTEPRATILFDFEKKSENDILKFLEK